MKKIAKQILSVLMAVLILSTGIIPAFADVPVMTLDIKDKCYAGTAPEIIATISGLSAEQASADEKLVWSVSGDSGATVVQSKNDFKSELQDNGTYTVTESATVSFSLESVAKDITISASFGGTIAQNSVTVNLLKPIQTISITQTDSSGHAYYDKDSSYLYIDQYTNETSMNENYAVLNVSSEPADHQDELNAPYISNEYTTDAEKCVSCDVGEESNSYTIKVSSKSDSESKITFTPKSGYSAQKDVFIKKCIPLTSFNLKANETVFMDGSANTLPAIKGDNIEISVINAAPKSSNDAIDYKLYDENMEAVSTDKYKVEYNSSNRGCTLSINGIGKFYLVASAVSYNGSNLNRNLSCTMGISVTEANPITDLSFNSPSYKIYTLRENTIALAGELNTTPSMDENTDTIEYVSVNPEIATVDKISGVVKAVKSGVATITATAVRGNKSTSCQITVVEAINTITLSSESGNSVLPLGHKNKINAAISPVGAEEKISWSSSRPDIVSVDQNGNIQTVSYNSSDVNSNNVIITAKSESGAEGTITITAEPAVRASKITLTPEQIDNCALQTIDASNNIYSIYKGDSVYIGLNAESSSGAVSNDVILWRVRIGGGESITLDEAMDSGFIEYSITGNNITVKSKTNLDMVFKAYAVLSGQVYTDAIANKAITIRSNSKTTAIALNPSAKSKVMPVNSTYEFYVTLNPNEDLNKDSVVAVSSSEAIASVKTEQINQNYFKVTVTALQKGDATITCYACYNAADPINTAVRSQAVKITVTNNIEDTIVEGITNVTYRGSAYTVKDFSDFRVISGNSVLVNGTDYTVSYSNNTNVGTATITITGKNGVYQGTKTIQFAISPKELTAENVKVTVSNVTYNGSEQKPKVTVKDIARNKNLTESTDYKITYSNNKNAGTGYATIVGIGNYSGSITIPFTIKTVGLGSAKITGLSAMTATGAPLTPVPTVTIKDKTLTLGVDYSLSYSNNVNAGKATVTVTGIGNYSGTKSATFTINAAAVPKKTVNTTVAKPATPAAPAKTTTNKAAAPKGSKVVNGEYINKKQKKAAIVKLTKGKKSFKAAWKKVKGITGYQIQYSTSKKFTKKTTKKVTVSKAKAKSATVKKLKGGKKYYVRIRTYKTVKFNGKKVKVYSSWSKAKSVTIKK